MANDNPDLERITVESAENGYMVTCQYAAPGSGSVSKTRLLTSGGGAC